MKIDFLSKRFARVDKLPPQRVQSRKHPVLVGYQSAEKWTCFQDPSSRPRNLPVSYYYSFFIAVQCKLFTIFPTKKKREFLAPGAPCEINIDGRTMDLVQHEMKRPSRFTFDRAAEHVYNLLLKKDCYPRFVRSDHYKQLLANALQPSQKKRYSRTSHFIFHRSA